MKMQLTLLACLIAGLQPASAGSETDLRFRVLLDDEPIGQHRFELSRDGDTREVISQADFKVRVLFMDLYRYRHTATERWRGGCLVSLDARTDDNGAIETVDASRSGDSLLVRTTRSEQLYRGCVRSFAYWNPEILEGGRLLNAQTGEYLPVLVVPMGEERIVVNGASRSAKRYRLTGEEVAIDLWYTPDNQWVALESRLDDGYRLRYERN